MVIQTDHCFNLHDLATLRVTRRVGRVADRLGASTVDKVWGHYRCDPIDDPDIHLHVGAFKPDLKGCYRVDRRYYVRPNFIAFPSTYKGAKWFTQIEGLDDGKITIRVSSNLRGHLAYSLLAPRGMIDLQLIKREALPIHGGAVMHPNGQGIVFPARSGVGKTITAISLARKGYRLLGDDYSIVHKQRMHSLAVPFNLRFTYDVETLHGKRFSASTRRELTCKKLISLATLRNVNLLTKVPIREVFTDCLAETAPLKRLYLLQHGEAFGVERDVPLEEVVRGVEANMWFEFDELRKLILTYASCFPGSWLAGFWENYRRLLAQNLQGVPCDRIRVPTVYDPATVESVVQTVSGDMAS